MIRIQCAELTVTLNNLADVATIITGIAAVGLGILVYRLTRNTDRWNKFERRLAIYQATRSYLAGIVTHGTTDTDNATTEWWRAMKGYQFLFGADVTKLIDDIWNDGDHLDLIRRKIRDARQRESRVDKLDEQQDVIWQRMRDRFTTLDSHFEGPLNFRDN